MRKLALGQWLFSGRFLPPRGHLAIYGDSFVTQCVGDCVCVCYWHLVAEARDATQYPVMHRTAPKEK